MDLTDKLNQLKMKIPTGFFTVYLLCDRFTDVHSGVVECWCSLNVSSGERAKTTKPKYFHFPLFWIVLLSHFVFSFLFFFALLPFFSIRCINYFFDRLLWVGSVVSITFYELQQTIHLFVDCKTIFVVVVQFEKSHQN